MDEGIKANGSEVDSFRAEPRERREQAKNGRQLTFSVSLVGICPRVFGDVAGINHRLHFHA